LEKISDLRLPYELVFFGVCGYSMNEKKITKIDILDSIYQKTEMNRREIREVVDLFLNDIKGALVKGTVVELRGFGTFEVRIRKGRSKAKNPRTGTPVSVSSHGAAVFRPGRQLKQDVWRLYAEDPVPAAPDSAPAVPAGDDVSRNGAGVGHPASQSDAS
jgi:integration host factor subunit beta